MGIIGSAINGAVQAGSTAAQLAMQDKWMHMQIDAQREMNERNVSSQEEMNRQNISFQKEVNDLMRKDNASSIQTKKNDLKKAGYSTADPSLQGSSVASLTAPRGEAPIVQSEITPDMVSQYMQNFGSSMDRLSGIAKSVSELSLMKAQARAANAGATGQEIDNDWKEALNSAEYSQILQTIDNMKSAKKLTDEQAINASKQFEILQAELDGLSADNAIKNYEVVYHPFRYLKEMEQMDAVIGELQAKTANWKADTSNKRKEGDILEFRKRIEKVAADFAEMGVNFNGSSMLDSILRLVASPRGSELGSAAVSYIRKTLQGITDSLPEIFEDGNIFKSLIPGYGIVHGAKTAYQFLKGGS